MSILGRLRPKSAKTLHQDDFQVNLRCLFCSEQFTLSIRVNDTVAVALISGLCPCCDWVSKLRHLETVGYLQFLEREMANTVDQWWPA